ncbi:MAG: ADOP family duplicated permease [Vicinamibacterales bacterium]
MKLWRRLTRWWSARSHDAALTEELEHHRSLVQADLERGGLTAHDADVASRRAMGNLTLVREDARDVWVVAWVDRLRRNLRFGVRGLRREPTFAVSAMATLAIGVATTTTVFSVVDAELWKPLPYPDADQLVVVVSRADATGARVDGLSGADLLDWRRGAPAFQALASTGRYDRRVLQRETAESVLVQEVTANYFDTFGRRPMAGRPFTAEDARGRRAVMFTDRGWRRVFGTDVVETGVTVDRVTIDGESFDVAGVVRADDTLGPDPDLFLTIDEGRAAFLDRATPMGFGAIGRLAPGATADVARAQVQAVVAATASPDSPMRQPGHAVLVASLVGWYGRGDARPLYFFLGASFIVLLLTAVNVAALLVGRAQRRSREFALRGALGGGQRALTGQLLTEAVLLAMPGGSLGLLLSVWALGALATAMPPGVLFRGTQIPIDLRMAVFAIGVTTLTAAVFVLMPLATARRVFLAGALGAGGRAGAGVAEGRARVRLLVAQMALTVVLLAGAGLFLRSYVGLAHVPLGFDPSDAFSVSATLSGPRYDTEAGLRDYAAAARDAALAIPGVRVAAVGSSSPLRSGPVVNYARAGEPAPAEGQASRAILRAVTPGFFDGFGMPIVRGRAFTAADGTGAPRVAIVNETLAEQAFGTTEVIGRVIDLLPNARAPWTRHPGPLRIVGVVPNVKEVGLNEVDFADIFVPFDQMPAPWIELVARVARPRAGVGEALRRAMAAIDPSLPVGQVVPLDARVDDAMREDRFNTLVVVAFAALAVLLAAVGVYGSVAYAMEARQREFGVRLAMGATPRRLILGALARAARLGLVSAVIGLACTLIVARLMGNALYLVPGSHNGLLYGVETTDPATLGAAFAAIVALAVAAAFVPALRCGRLDPVSALRKE